MARQYYPDLRFDQELFKRELDEYLSRQGKSRSAVSELWGFERSYLGKVYNGSCIPSRERLSVICEHLGLLEEQFFARLPDDRELAVDIQNTAGLLNAHYQRISLYMMKVMLMQQRMEEHEQDASSGRSGSGEQIRRPGSGE